MVATRINKEGISLWCGSVCIDNGVRVWVEGLNFRIEFYGIFKQKKKKQFDIYFY